MRSPKQLLKRLPPFNHLYHRLQVYETNLSKLQVKFNKNHDSLMEAKNSPREWLAAQYLKGQGIEIGAKSLPLKVPRGVKVKYLDHLNEKGLAKKYPSVPTKDLVNVDIVDDGERLGRVKDNSQDFIIANHFVEHTLDPIQTIENMYSKLKPNGILYIALPDKRLTFDKPRRLTSYHHLLAQRHKNPPQNIGTKLPRNG